MARLAWIIALMLPLLAQDIPRLPDALMQRLLFGDREGFLIGLKSAAGAGDGTAMFYLGRVWEEMEGFPHDYAQAMEWYRKAAESSSGPGAWSLGRLYEFGRGAAADPAEAQRWYKRALELGFRRTALTQIFLRWTPGDTPLSEVGDSRQLHPEELRLLREAGLKGQVELQGLRPGHSGLPARVIVVASRPVLTESDLAIPFEGFLIHIQREGDWQTLPAGAKASTRKLKIGPQKDHPENTQAAEELEGSMGLQGGLAFSWPPQRPR